MAMIETARPAPFGAITTYRAISTVLDSVGTTFDDLTERFAAWRTAKELARLTPAQLADIGLCKADVLDMRARASLL